MPGPNPKFSKFCANYIYADLYIWSYTTVTPTVSGKAQDRLMRSNWVSSYNSFEKESDNFKF